VVFQNHGTYVVFNVLARHYIINDRKYILRYILADDLTCKIFFNPNAGLWLILISVVTFMETYNGLDLEYRTALSMDIHLASQFPQHMFTSNTCAVCLGKNPAFESYILPCKHSCHTRCYRRFADSKKSLDCPICGKIEWGVPNAREKVMEPELNN